MRFEQVQEFLISWGVYPQDEQIECGSEEDVNHFNGLNKNCYDKLINDADEDGQDSDDVRLYYFCHKFFTEKYEPGYHYSLNFNTWVEARSAWIKFKKTMSASGQHLNTVCKCGGKKSMPCF